MYGTTRIFGARAKDFGQQPIGCRHAPIVRCWGIHVDAAHGGAYAFYAVCCLFHLSRCDGTGVQQLNCAAL
jgi:hypothetical protein